MRNDPTILKSARAGFFGELNPAIWSSSVWLAHEAGVALLHQGATAPTHAHASRGYSTRVRTAGGSEFLVAMSGPDLKTATVTRLV